jgi:DNA invertase Pin-like site-specific DNA recombinase
MKPTKAYSYIRMSTAIQLKGDSKRRQQEKSRAYAEKHNLELVEDYSDIGISAFRGQNVESGELGAFIQQIESKRIESGSYLLVESFDRLSRQNVLTAIELFIKIIRSGIVLVTLMDGNVYTSERCDTTQLLYSIMIMGRAFEESKTKSERVRSAWTNKRTIIDTKKLTARCPSWLELSDDKKIFSINKHRANVVRKIFRYCVDGYGIHKIAFELNRDGVPSFGSSRAWRNSSIERILNNPAVIGEFQSYTLRDGQRVAAGPPVRGYFPSIIDEELFYRARAAKTSRRQGAAGRKGAHLTNLFSGLARCGYCGAAMHYIDKGTGPKGGKYLVCGDANRGLTCERIGWRYDHFETSFLTFVTELDLPAVLQDQTEDDELKNLEAKIQAKKGRRDEIKSQIDILLELLSRRQAFGSEIEEKIGNLATEKASIESILMKNEGKLEELRYKTSVTPTGSELKELIDAVGDKQNPELFRLRIALQEKIKSITRGITLMPTGERPMAIRRLDRIQATDHYEDFRDVIKHFWELQNMELIDKRFFTVLLPNDTCRIVWPSADNPSNIIQELYASKTRINRNVVAELGRSATQTG